MLSQAVSGISGKDHFAFQGMEEVSLGGNTYQTTSEMKAKVRDHKEVNAKEYESQFLLWMPLEKLRQINKIYDEVTINQELTNKDSIVLNVRIDASAR